MNERCDAKEEGNDCADAHVLVMFFELAHGHHDTRRFRCRCAKQGRARSHRYIIQACCASSIQSKPFAQTCPIVSNSVEDCYVKQPRYFIHIIASRSPFRTPNSYWTCPIPTHEKLQLPSHFTSLISSHCFPATTLILSGKLPSVLASKLCCGLRPRDASSWKSFSSSSLTPRGCCFFPAMRADTAKPRSRSWRIRTGIVV